MELRARDRLNLICDMAGDDGVIFMLENLNPVGMEAFARGSDEAALDAFRAAFTV